MRLISHDSSNAGAHNPPNWSCLVRRVSLGLHGNLADAQDASDSRSRGGRPWREAPTSAAPHFALLLLSETGLAEG